MLGGVPHQRRVTRSAGPGNPFRWGTFLHVKAAEWGSPPSHDNHIIAPKSAKTHGRTIWLPTATSVASYFDDFTSKTAKTLMKLTVLSTIEAWNRIVRRISVWNQTEVLPATTTLKRKAASAEQTKKTNVSSLYTCLLSDCVGLYVKTSISLPRVGEVPHLAGVSCFDVNRP